MNNSKYINLYLLGRVFLCLLAISNLRFGHCQEIELENANNVERDAQAGHFDVKFGSTIFGLNFGGRMEEVLDGNISTVGKVSLSTGDEYLLLGQTVACRFRNGRMDKVEVRDLLLGHFRNVVEASEFDREDWTLSNGIQKGMEFSEVERILGEALLEVENGYGRINYVFSDSGWTVVLFFTESRYPNGDRIRKLSGFDVSKEEIGSDE